MEMEETIKSKDIKDVADHFKEVLRDYWICLVSRESSLLARKEVLTGKAKFGIVGDGKELPQIALAKYFKKGSQCSSARIGREEITNETTRVQARNNFMVCVIHQLHM